MILWPLAVLLSLAGWGEATSRVLRALTGADLHFFADKLALALAICTTLAGLAVAVDAAGRSFLYGVVGAGLVLLSVSAFGRVRILVRTRSTSLTYWLPAVAVVAAVLLISLWWTAHWFWNACDDDVAYLYLAKRLVVRGNLLDPLNNRRLTSLGGMSAVQSLFLVRLSETFLPLADIFLGSLLLVTSLWRTRRGWSVYGIAATLLIVVLPEVAGADNTSPVLLPAGLILVAMGLLLRLRGPETSSREDIGFAVVVGLVAGLTTTLRPQFGFPLALLVFLIEVWPPLARHTAQRICASTIGLLATLLPWSVASLRAVRTPIFPPFHGNLNPAWPATGPRTTTPTLTAVARRVLEAPHFGAWMAAGLIGVTLMALQVWRQRNREMSWALRIVATSVVLSIAWLTALVLVWWNVGGPSSWGRFIGPLFLATALVPLLVVNRSGPMRGRLSGVSGLAGLLAVVVLVSPSPRTIWRRTSAIVRESVDGKLEAALTSDRYAALRPLYRAAVASIPRGSKVLTAVDVPSLLLSSHATIHTLDIPGSTSPPPQLPYFRGVPAKLAWMRSMGYSYVIAEDPSSSACLYNDALWLKNLRLGGIYGSWAPFAIDWSNFLEVMRSGGATTSFGGLLVVNLRGIEFR